MSSEEVVKHFVKLDFLTINELSDMSTELANELGKTVVLGAKLQKGNYGVSIACPKVNTEEIK